MLEATTISAAGKVGKVQLYSCRKIGFANIGVKAATIARALNIFPVSWGSIHLLNKDLTRLNFEVVIITRPCAK